MIKVAKDDELNRRRSESMANTTSRYPLAITGNVCIGRGVSITSEDVVLHTVIVVCEVFRSVSKQGD